MTDPCPEVLVVGATGMLGTAIALALLARGEARLRVLVRPASRARLSALETRGAVVVEGDVLDPASVDRAVTGVAAVISSLGNDATLLLDGQGSLLAAAARHGVRRFVPSDFSVDYRKLDAGDNANLDLRRRFLPILERSGVPYTLVLQGAFTEMLVEPFMGIIDADAGTYRYWGDGRQPMDFTTVADTARYTAAAVLDPRFADRALCVAGDQLGHDDIRRAYEAATGRTLEPRHLGSVAELRRWIERTRATATSAAEYLAAQYQWAMVSGKAKLDPVMNAWFPAIRPTTVAEFFAGRRG